MNLKKVSESNMADLGTKALEKDRIDRSNEKFGMRMIRPVESRTHGRGVGVSTPQYDCDTRSTLPSISTTNPALLTESVSAHVCNQVHQEQSA